MADLAPPPAPSGPFEGPEKLLEIWFAPSAADCPDAASSTDGKFGLRRVPRPVWEEMLDIVKCKILSAVEGTETDAYLLRAGMAYAHDDLGDLLLHALALSRTEAALGVGVIAESSFFVSPHRLILKTCGTTLNLLGVPRILEIARDHAGLPSVYRLFYSRKAFMFPERQIGPHREWKAEIEFLDNLFPNGSAYTVGKVNGDHWLLYLTSPGDSSSPNGDTAPNSPIAPHGTYPPIPSTSAAAESSAMDGDADDADDTIASDYTIEILMTHLSPEGRAPFFNKAPPEDADATAGADGMALSSEIGITNLFPKHLTTLDAYSFSPCGYSCNALLKWRPDAGQNPSRPGEGYYTIHVTPEEGWSYASFECNVPLPTSPTDKATSVPDLKTLIRRVVDIFRPGRLTLTLFISSKDNDAAEEEEGESTVEAAQRAFKSALTLPPKRSDRGDDAGERGGAFAGLYKRTDKINYEFGGYDLAFASFELRSS
ncbi:S-adenosylmethionine decarboxylase [Cubamyces sp. BRFM 1775]|nr:S-adenosylmethionine decarboxylase [Cubamyces sp. BRFM 1775]